MFNLNNLALSHYAETNRLITSLSQMITQEKVQQKDPFWNNSARQLLEGLIDIYLPDFKYYNDKLGKYSNISNYFETASLALKEMYRQVGKLRYNKDGILVKGMIVRHLVLPNKYYY